MDLASTVFNLAVGIVNFISEHEDKESLQEQISDIVVQIQNVIAPLLLRELTDEPLKQVLQSLLNVLSNVDSHLRSWKESRSRRMIALVNPWAVTQEVKEDRVQLMHQYILLMGAMQVVDHVKGYNLYPSEAKEPPPSPGSSKQGKAKAKVDEVLEFWNSYIGSDLEVVKSRQLCEHLSTWSGKKLGNVARSRLLLRLDENRSGYVTLKTLQQFARNKKLKEHIELYSSDPKFPLLVWISDDITINTAKAGFAQTCGVSVVQLVSTTTAKAWIKVNQSVLKKHDNPADLRFITDQVRIEPNSAGVPYKNRQAGNHITKFIRDEGFSSPILVFTGRQTLPKTRYVESYPMTGSAAGAERYERFISALGKRRKDDKDWVGCGATT
ncbi:hypothetical protein GALMADRAFT_134695 [Galerina marginata CBS 339.88]|uniref:Uncharacterized protein n=1 Tax=Galerina marginata (strain CBS 339.88) TaxID=685588 RepID=A0A067TLI4_GALM3|nr:hypothetical protein GALMADRAFT_134695 [Galerina marginata CBS 339.88]